MKPEGRRRRTRNDNFASSSLRIFDEAVGTFQ